MHRNLDRRVEVLVQLPSADSKAQVHRLLDLAFAEETSAWELASDGVWTRNEGNRDYQETLIEHQRRP
jgi:polyphosphate kinase